MEWWKEEEMSRNWSNRRNRKGRGSGREEEAKDGSRTQQEPGGRGGRQGTRE